jgi:hypothetical protein
MKFAEVVDSLMEGKPISRTGWENNNYIFYDKDDNCFVFVSYPDDIERRYELASVGLDLYPRDIIADDWDIDIWDSIPEDSAEALDNSGNEKKG